MTKRNKFIVKETLADIQLTICEALYKVSGQQGINNYADKVKMAYSECKGCESITPTIITINHDNCATCGGEKTKQILY